MSRYIAKLMNKKVKMTYNLKQREYNTYYSWNQLDGQICLILKNVKWSKFFVLSCMLKTNVSNN
jgi:hypothetical protein